MLIWKVLIKYLVIRQDEQVAAGVIAHVTADMVGISVSLRTLGFAAAARRPALPVTVFPDPPSVPP